MATLVDTSALAVLIRRTRAPAFEPLAVAARDEIAAGRALVSAVTVVELLVGASGGPGFEELSTLLAALPVVSADREVAGLAGRMGAHARRLGRTIPLPDLLIAATAVRLELPLLTCDRDFARGRELGTSPKGGARGDREGRRLWSRLAFHPASVPTA
jgi:predicted nucleic acid-binding protein